MPDLRPGNRGSRGECTLSRTGNLVQRATIDTLTAWDPLLLCTVTLAAGQILRGCRIAHSREIGPQLHSVPYVAEFEVDGRMYCCPLSGFQPRTRILEDLEMVPDPARK